MKDVHVASNSEKARVCVPIGLGCDHKKKLAREKSQSACKHLMFAQAIRRPEAVRVRMNKLRRFSVLLYSLNTANGDGCIQQV